MGRGAEMTDYEIEQMRIMIREQTEAIVASIWDHEAATKANTAILVRIAELAESYLKRERGSGGCGMI